MCLHAAETEFAQIDCSDGQTLTLQQARMELVSWANADKKKNLKKDEGTAKEQML